MRVLLTGQWREAVRNVNALARNLQRAGQRVIAHEAHYWASEIRDGIRTQRSAQEANWPPLKKGSVRSKHWKTNKKTGEREHGKKMLIETATLLNSIVAQRVSKWRWLVGVKRGAVGKKGEDLVNIAAVHEFGSKKANIPARPYIAPVMKRLKKDLVKRLMDRFEKNIAPYMK